MAKARRRGGVPIVLTHAPDVAGKLSAALPLVLAGHTHCGQVVLPWFGPLLTRGRCRAGNGSTTRATDAGSSVIQDGR
jgi:predicted MPP superfamily phosphohydrolase